MILRKFLTFLMILGISVSVFADDKSKITSTSINVFKPVAIKAEVKPGFCWMNSIAIIRPDAWRCTVGSEISDPCFALGSQDMMVCNVNPVKNERGFLLKLTKPLPKQIQVKAPKVNAWMVELENGQICEPYTGAMLVVRDSGEPKALQYGCQNAPSGEYEALIMDSILPGKIWRAQKISYVLDNLKVKTVKIQDVAIKGVWQ